MLFRFLSILLFSSVFSSIYAQALPTRSNWGSNAWGRGGATVASAFNDDAFLNNPAGLVRYYGNGAMGGYWMDLPEGQEKWNVHLIDGKRNVVGGLSFDWTELGGVRRMGISPGAAYKTDYGSFGVSMNIFEFKGLGEDNGWAFSETMGVFVPIGGGAAIAASINSFLDSTEDTIIPPELRTGFLYRKENLFLFSFQADRRFEVPNQDWNYSFGVDLLVKEFYAIRGGYRMENTDDKGSFWSVGAVLKAPKMEIGGFYTKLMDRSSDGFGFSTSLLF